MIIPPSNLKKLLGLDLSDILNRLQTAEYKLNKLESPSRQEAIANLLREHGKHNRSWITSRIQNYQWYDLEELIKKGIVIETKSGNHRMYGHKLGMRLNL